jgi:dienelactone hydrolase
MVRTSGGDSAVGKLPDFFFDKYEVTNKQFKEFIDRGGYQKKEYWKHEFVKDGKTLVWEDAMALFQDATGRPGPAEWQAGDYPEGQDDYPVAGVSWYEAAAYAEFAHKSLPTIYHWDIALANDVLYNLDCLPSIFSSVSNFDDRPVPAGSSQSLSFFGSYDLAGNVREWCWNESPEGRCIRGGAWGDVAYMMTNITQASTFNRSPKNGFRCIRLLETDKIPEDAFKPFEIAADTRDYYKEKPVSDEVFQIYKDQFSYDKAELNSKVEEVDQTPKNWIKERVSFNAAYGTERVIAYLYLPRKETRPFQTVIFFPGAVALVEKSSKDVWYEEDNIFDFIIKNGRAVMFPVYKGTYERSDEHSYRIYMAQESRQHVEHSIKVVKDFKRCIDYLETRTDIDSKKLAYYGYSWGGWLGNIIPAVEERLKVSIVHLGGLKLSGITKINPAGDPFNYVTRVKIPTLMLNGKYDVIFQYEAAVKPMYDLLGTPHKDLILCESDHHIPKNDLIRESLKWLDKYLGPVNN